MRYTLTPFSGINTKAIQSPGLVGQPLTPRATSEQGGLQAPAYHEETLESLEQQELQYFMQTNGNHTVSFSCKAS